MDAQQVSDLFMIFNVSGDGSMSKQEFVYCWNGWIKKIVRPRTAIIIVDVQNDFISGSLAVINCPAAQNGEEVKLINGVRERERERDMTLFSVLAGGRSHQQTD